MKNGTARFPVWTARFTVAIVIEALLVLTILFLAFFLPGCAARQARAETPRPKFWNGCQETTPAIADGFQHFVCLDVHNKQWEVLVRLQPKR